MEAIFADFERIVPDAMTHWQHPRFLAYFPANAAPASMIADQLATAMAAQCMLWQTSPAATEMEGRMVDWLRQAIGLPEGFSGTLQDSASTATLCAVLTMRERALGWQGSQDGLAGGARGCASTPRRRTTARSTRRCGSPASARRTSSRCRPAPIAAFTAWSRTSSPPPSARTGRPDTCRQAWWPAPAAPRSAPSTRWPTSSTIARAEDLFVHVDAAWAGSAMICPEFRELWRGAGEADSLVFNPHKWLGAQFECSAHFVRDPAALVRTVGIRPSFLETLGQDGIVNYNEWSVPLGRRFRALKVWFLLRAHGLEGLRARIRNHVAWAEMAAERIAAAPGLEVVTGPVLSLFTFAHEARRRGDAGAADAAERRGPRLSHADGARRAVPDPLRHGPVRPDPRGRRGGLRGDRGGGAAGWADSAGGGER